MVFEDEEISMDEVESMDVEGLIMLPVSIIDLMVNPGTGESVTRVQSGGTI